MNKKIVIGVIIFIVAIGAGVFLMNQKDENTSSSSLPLPTSQDTNSASNNDTSSDSTAPAATITYSDNGFSPATTTVKSGSTITIKNTSSGPLQFDSDPHPEHTEDPELNVGLIEAGSSKQVTVTTTGSHGYHNHLSSGDTGTIVVN